MSSVKLVKRSEVPQNQKWNLQTLFKDRYAMYQEAERLMKEVDSLSTYRGKFVKDANSFYEFILKYEKFKAAWERTATYAFLVMAVDATSNVALEDAAKIRSINAEIQEKIAFIKADICKLSREELDAFYKAKPELKGFERFIEDTYKYKEHLLSEQTEEVLAAFNNVLQAPEFIYEISAGSDLSFDDFKVDNGEVLPNSFTLFEEKYQDDANTDIRRKAFLSFNKGLKKYQNTFASVYATEVEKQRVEAKLRGFGSTIDMLLFEQGIDRAVYDKHLDVLFNNLAPKMRKYADIIKKQMNLAELKFADLKAALDEEYAPAASFADVKEIILEAVSIYGDEYVENIKRMFDANLIDYATNIGKSSGAFCSSPHGTDSFINMTFTDTMRSAFTLVHELGHAGHFMLANKYQNSLNSECSLYCVEAPSTLNELVLAKYLKSKATSKEVERWVILQNLASYYHNCVTHFLEAILQDRVYKHIDNGGQVNANYLNTTKLEVIREFWGDSVHVEEDAGLTWMRQGHYYIGLYPYTYSASLSISTQVFKMLEEDEKGTIEKWLDVLKTGGSLSTAELMKKVNIDISKEDMFIALSEYVGSLVDRLEELYD